MRKAFVVLFAAFFLLISLHVFAQQQPVDQTGSPQFVDHGAGYLPYSDPSPFGSGGMLGALARTIFALAIVLGLLYFVLWGLRKVTSNTAVSTSGNSIRVVGRIYLNQKTIIYFLRLVDELLVLGASSGNISLLTTIKDPVLIEKIENSLKGAQPYASGKLFSRFFDRSMHRFQKVLEKEDDNFDDQIQELENQIGRLKGLGRRGNSREK
jgi:flagellar biosynthetic protein FliO